MGFESARFSYSPDRSPAGGWEHFLSNKGAERRPSGTSRFRQYALKSSGYWIDFQILAAGGVLPERISIRIALCNPEQATEQLLNSLRLLLEEGGGAMVDENSGRRIRAWDSAAESTFRESLLQQQRRFRRFFGDRRAAVPAEEVFDIVRGPTE